MNLLMKTTYIFEKTGLELLLLLILYPIRDSKQKLKSFSNHETKQKVTVMLAIKLKNCKCTVKCIKQMTIIAYCENGCSVCSWSGHCDIRG